MHIQKILKSQRKYGGGLPKAQDGSIEASIKVDENITPRIELNKHIYNSIT